MTRFCVICAQRSGSTWLVDLLASSPDITAYGEVFIERESRADSSRRTAPAEIRHLEPPLPRPHWRAAHLARSVETLGFLWQLEATRTQPGAIGYKVMYDQLRRRPELLAYFAARRYRLIHLVRENVLEQLVSERLAERLDLYHVTHEQPLRQVELLPASLLGELRARRERSRRIGRWLRRVPVPQLELTYEALRANPARELPRIEQLLRAPGALAHAQSELRRMAPGRLRDKITNYDEVARVLHGTELQPLLDRGENEARA